MAKYGRETNDADIRARQQRDLDKASKMMEEDRNSETRKKYTADQLEKRLRFMTDAMYQDRKQRELDAEIADKPKREAANEILRESRGVQPTPEKDRRDMATHNYYKGFNKPLFGGKEGLPIPGMKKGGKVKKYNSGGTATSKPEPKKDTMPEWEKNERANRKQDELNKREAEGAAKEVKRNMSTFGFKNGGSASSRADGIAQRGKTRGKIC
jgi:hypothetical protein